MHYNECNITCPQSAQQSRTMTNLAVKCSLCDANHARKKCDVLRTYLIPTLLVIFAVQNQPLLYLPFKLHLKRDCSQIHLHKTGFKTCTLTAHRHTADVDVLHFESSV